MMNGLIALLCIILILCAYEFKLYIQEKKSFNKGICPICNTPYTVLDITVGSRGYKCEKYHYTWINRRSIDKEF